MQKMFHKFRSYGIESLEGLEPPPTDPNSVVLPLNYRDLCVGTRGRTRNCGFGSHYDAISPYLR